MVLNPGAKLGPYEILSPLGSGGMGEVYRAKDTRLDRVVAVKVLPEVMARDPVALARFEREAKAVAALSHPGILALHDIGTENGISFAVMELLEGESLRARLTGGPPGQRKLLDFARQIAEGLAAAHERGIVHRDLKPENLWVTPDGRIKILDFGLAKVREEPGPARTDHQTPTQSVATAPGIVMGTAGYMSPEQVRGEPLDHRSDLFSFGAVLYEMATGQRAFRGDSAVETMNAILKEEPPAPALNAPIAPGLERIIRHCLEKKPGERFQSARDLAFDLSSLTGTSAAAPLAAGAERKKSARLALLMGGVALLSLLAGALLTRAGRRDGAVPAVSAIVPLPAAAAFRLAGVPELSPDGGSLLFSGLAPEETQPVWIRPLNADEARPLPGTEGAVFAFWSPDGRAIGFFQGRKLKRLDLAGGAPVTLCELPERSARGGSWSRDGVILFAGARTGGLSRVPATGGTPEPVTRLDEKRGDTTHRWPHFLPDGRHFIYYASPNTAPNQQALYFASLDGGESRILLPQVSNAVYASGRLLYVNSEGKLLARRFDPGQGLLSGEPQLLAEGVGVGYGISRALFTASASGRLAYVPKNEDPLRTMEWIDRSGNRVGQLGEPLFYSKARITADGAHVIVSIVNPLQKQADLWEYEISGGGRRRLSFSPGEHWTPVYSPDGKRLYAISRDDGKNSVVEFPLGGGRETKTAIDAMQAEELLDASPDGRWLAVNVWNPKAGTNYDIFLLPTSGERTLRPFLNGPEDEATGRFSPAGRWFAYESSESGRAEIYVQSYPDPGVKWQVSTAGGANPLWRRDGRELYFTGADDRLMAVSVAAGEPFHAGPPAPLFAGTISHDISSLDAAPDGQRFLRVAAPPAPFAVRLLLGWPERLERGARAPD